MPNAPDLLLNNQASPERDDNARVLTHGALGQGAGRGVAVAGCGTSAAGCVAAAGGRHSASCGPALVVKEVVLLIKIVKPLKNFFHMC